MERPLPALLAGKVQHGSKFDKVSHSHNLETFTLKSLTRDYHTVDTIQNTQRVKMGMECDGSIFIMHESIPFEGRVGRIIPPSLHPFH